MAAGSSEAEGLVQETQTGLAAEYQGLVACGADKEAHQAGGNGGNKGGHM